MEENSTSFGQWLRRQRRARDLTQEELADRVGCALVSLRKIEAGERRPSKDVAQRLAAALSIPEPDLAAFLAFARAVFPEYVAPPPATPQPDLAIPTARANIDRSRRTELGEHNLPVQLTSFIGREREMVEVLELLRTTRLLTLTGAGGAGKTRLALQVAVQLVDAFPDGVWLVDLARLSEGNLVPQAIGSALGLRDEARRPLLDQLLGYFRERHLLLLLDNCEHIVDACASVVEVFLRGAAGLRVLATSREPLGIGGELTFHVPSLQVPDPQQPPSYDDRARIPGAPSQTGRRSRELSRPIPSNRCSV